MTDTEKTVVSDKLNEKKINPFLYGMIHTMDGVKFYRYANDIFPHDSLNAQIYDKNCKNRYAKALAYIDEISTGRRTRFIRAQDGSVFALQFKIFDDLRDMLKVVSRLVRSSACVGCQITRIDQEYVTDFRYKPVTDYLYYIVYLDQYNRDRFHDERGIDEKTWAFAVRPESGRDVGETK